MPTQLVYPIRAAAPTTTFQLVLDLTAGAPRVAETPTIGYPFELSQLTLSTTRDTTTLVWLTFLLTTFAYTSGEARAGLVLHRLTGDNLPTDRRHLPYFPVAPLTLRPRIQVREAGYRIRMVHDTATASPSVRCLLVLTPMQL